MKLYTFILLLILTSSICLTSCVKDSDEDDAAVTECTVTSFSQDDTIQSACGLTVDPNHIVIRGLSVPAGEEFTLFVRTTSSGSGGGVFTFDGDTDTMTATYKGSAATDSEVSIGDDEYWLVGFHVESPGVHIVVKASHDSALDPENYTSVIDIEPDGWLTGEPSSSSVYYRATSGVSIQSIRIFYEQHDHEGHDHDNNNHNHNDNNHDNNNHNHDE